MQVGTRVTSTTNLGAVREDGPRARFACTVPKGSVGTVVEVDVLPGEPGWLEVKFDAPWDTFESEPIVVMATTAWLDVWP